MESKEELNILISCHLPPDCKIHNYTIRSLDSGGQHFSSDVKEVRVDVENKDGTNSQLDLVMKVMPGKEKQVEVNSKLGFQKEVAFFQLAVPEYHKTQTDYNMDVQNLFPKFYNASAEVIILGDLRCLHYSGLSKSLDEEHTRLVLRELAKFHATGVALKLSNPNIFQSRLASVVAPALQNTGNVKKEEINKKLRLEITMLLKSLEGFDSFAEIVDNIMRNIDNIGLPIPSEPYATLIHNDLWIGNILFKYSSKNVPNNVKFIDFQTTIYNSPARDLVYFLFTSVEKDVLNEFESLILFYHCVFTDYLSKLGWDPLQFSFEGLMNEVNNYGPTKLKHMILLFKTLCYSSGNDHKTFKQHLQSLVTKFRDRGWF